MFDMDQARPRFAALSPAMVVRTPMAIPFEPAVRALARRPGLREDVRLFVYAYVAGLTVFLTWLA
jgi:hypothetical protein